MQPFTSSLVQRSEVVQRIPLVQRSTPRGLTAVVMGATLVFTMACSKPTGEAVEGTGVLNPVEMPATHPTVTPLPDPESNGGHAGRAPRRISVPQLKASIATVTNGQQWSQIDTLAASLGQADFALTVSDSTEANLVFAKFLEDGAREVCLKVAKADLTAPQEKRVLSSGVPGTDTDFTKLSDAVVQQNLSTMAVRFWGSPFDAEELSAWTETFKKVAARATTSKKPEQAWGAMCVAMMTDPRFITY